MKRMVSALLAAVMMLSALPMTALGAHADDVAIKVYRASSNGYPGYVWAFNSSLVTTTAGTSNGFAFGETVNLPLVLDASGTTYLRGADSHDGQADNTRVTASWSGCADYIKSVGLRKLYHGNGERWHLSIAVKSKDEMRRDGVTLPASFKLAGTVTLEPVDSSAGSFTMTHTFLESDNLVFQQEYGSSSLAVSSTKKVSGISQKAETRDGSQMVGLTDWQGHSAPGGVAYIPKGETVYYSLQRNNTPSQVIWDNYVEGLLPGFATLADPDIDPNDIVWESGGESVERIWLTAEPFDSTLGYPEHMPKWCLAVKIKDDAGITAAKRLEGTITLENRDSRFYTNSITLNIDTIVTPDSNPPEGLENVAGIDARVQTERSGVVGLTHWDGAAAPDGATFAKYGQTMYFAFKNGLGDAVSDEKYLAGAVVSADWDEGGASAGTPAVVKKSYNGADENYYLAVPVGSGSGLARLKGTVTVTNTTAGDGFNTPGGEISLPVCLLLADELAYPTAADDSRITQISYGTNGALVKNTLSGVVSNYDWYDGSAPATGVTYIPYGKTVYYFLRAEGRKSGSKNIVEAPEFVYGTEFDTSGLTNSEYIESVALEKHPSISGSTTVDRYFLAIRLKESGPTGLRLAGSIRMTNDTAFYGFDAANGTLSYGIDLGIGNPTTSRVSRILPTLLCEYRGVVAEQTVSGESVTGLTRLPYGYTAYYALIDEQDAPVTDDSSVRDVTVTADYGSDQAMVESAELVKMRYLKNSAATKWFVAVRFAPEPEGASDLPVSGTVTLKNESADWEDYFAAQNIQLKASLTLLSSAGAVVTPPTEGDLGRVFRFGEFGNRVVGIWPLVENDDGALERIVGVTGTTYTGTTPMIPYGSTAYYPLADCEGNLVTDEKYVRGIKLSAEWISYGQRLENIEIVKKRLELGDKKNEGVYGYCLALSFVFRDYSSRSNVVGEVTLQKKGKDGIATEDNTLTLWVDLTLTKDDVTLNPDYSERHQFADRILSDKPMRYNFVDPAYGAGGSNWALGTDEEDVIYLIGEMTSYITVDTRRQGRMQLSCSETGNPYFYDVYPEAELKFLICKGDLFYKKGVLTIELPDQTWHLYEIANGVLIEPINGVYDEVNGIWNITTKKLGSWCMSDVELDLDRQFFFEYDEFYYAVEGMSPYRPTEDITVELVGDALCEWPNRDSVTVYVQPGVTLNRALQQWAAKSLTKPLKLVSNRGWTVSLAPQLFTKNPKKDIVVAPTVETTAQSVLIKMSGNGLEPYGMQLPVTLTHGLIAALKAPRLYGCTADGKYLDFGPVEPAGNTVTFQIDRDMTYIITGMQIENAVPAAQAG